MTAGPTGRDGPHAFVADLEQPVLDDGDRHHLERVLRLRPGDRFTVSDGAGGWRVCRFGARVEPDGPVHRVDRPEPALTVGFALTKGERPEVAVQKLTELGVDRIVPFVAARSVVRWDDERAGRHVERLRRVAREASMQSRRVRLPVVDDVATFATAAALPGAALCDRDGAPPSLEHPTLLIGPEGGWADEERSCGLSAVDLGPQILRAETVALAAGTLLAALRSALIRPLSAHSATVRPRNLG